MLVRRLAKLALQALKRNAPPWPGPPHKIRYGAVIGAGRHALGFTTKGHVKQPNLEPAWCANQHEHLPHACLRPEHSSAIHFSSCPAGAGQIAASAASAAFQVSPLTPGRPLAVPAWRRVLLVPSRPALALLAEPHRSRVNSRLPRPPQSRPSSSVCHSLPSKRASEIRPEGASSDDTSDIISGVSHWHSLTAARIRRQITSSPAPRPVAKDSDRLARPAISAGRLCNKNSALPSPQRENPAALPSPSSPHTLVSPTVSSSGDARRAATNTTAQSLFVPRGEHLTSHRVCARSVVWA